MKLLKTFHVPTGEIMIVEGEKGSLECLSLGDYGKEQNLKADFLGLKKELDGVPHGELLPLEDKWVCTISSQYGCSMGCTFCDVPKVGPGRNASFWDMVEQVQTVVDAKPDVEYTDRLNVHFARMGEPTFNWDVINAATYLYGVFRKMGWGYHPVVSTMMPRINHVRDYLSAWMHLKNVIMKGEAGLQISINSTDEAQREEMFGGHAMTLEEIAHIVGHFKVVGRKITLNFALSPQMKIDAIRLSKLFDPKRFLCKLTPMHITNSVIQNHMVRPKDVQDYYQSYYPYRNVEQYLKDVGYDVIVFVPSVEEDEGRITCGNALLSGVVPACEHREETHG